MDALTATELSPVEQKLRDWRPDPALPAWYNAARQQAIDAYFTLDYPQKTDESWHYGNPRDFALDSFEPQGALLDERSTGLELVTGLLGEVSANNILLLAGHTLAELHTLPEIRDKGVLLSGLRQTMLSQPELLQSYHERESLEIADRTTASIAALSENGFVLNVPRGVELSEPIHLAAIAPEEGRALALRSLLRLEPNSRAEVYLHLLGHPGSQSGLMLSELQAEIASGASLSLSILQNTNSSTNLLSRQSISLARDASLRSFNVNLGGRRVRSELRCHLTEPGASAELYGMHILRGRERYDFHTVQDHLAPHCRSNLLYKGAMLGRSKASYQGVINVAPDAQKTDAYQSNRSLLLSPQARVDSSPQLEILANDVRCSHGSSITNVSEDALFYLASRGIDAASARNLLVSGFLREVSDRIAHQGVREYVQSHLLEQAL